MCIEFWFTLANIYKVFAQTHSMYMEFWLALGNVNRPGAIHSAVISITNVTQDS